MKHNEAHTPEPWDAPSAGIYAGPMLVATLGSRDVIASRRKHGGTESIHHDARRIAACVNFMAGTPTAAIEELVRFGVTFSTAED